MSFVTWKIERTPFNVSSKTWSSTSTTLTEYYDPVVIVNLGEARDTFNFKVCNFNDNFSNYFQPNDKITISRVINSTSTASSDIIMVGSVQNTPEEEDGMRTTVRVEGANFSETILGGIVFFDPRGMTIPTAIQAALNAIGVYNSNFTVTWNGSNPTTKSNGSAFPTVNEKWFNKPIKAFIEKYSVSDITGDGNYYYYVDKNNTLVWRQKSNSVTWTFNTASSPYKSLRINKDLKEVKNWVIIKGGTDPDGSPIQTRVQNMESISKHGLKPYILPSISKNAEMLVKEDKDRFGVTNMSSASYPLTPAWNGGSSVANYAAYVTALRVYVKSQCDLEGQAFLNARQYGKLKVDLEFSPGGVSWGLGDLVECTIPSLSSSAKNLRVTDIQYTTEADTYTLVEDIGSI